MADLIDRDVAIRMFSDYAETKQALDDYRETLMNVPAVNRWIPSSERMPEQTGYYLVWLDSEIVDIAEFYTYADFVQKEIAHNYWNKESKVLYWMPLPHEPESEVKQ